MYKSSIEREKADCESLLNKLKNPVIKERTKTCLYWFVEKAVRSKVYYYVLSTLSFLAPVVINIAMVFSVERLEIRLFVSIASGCAAVSAFFLQLLDVRKKWGIYRNQAEIIKNSLALYGTADHKDEEEFIKMIEASMSQTHEKWMKDFDLDK